MFIIFYYLLAASLERVLSVANLNSHPNELQLQQFIRVPELLRPQSTAAAAAATRPAEL